MSSFTPRGWKSQTAPQTEHIAAAAVEPSHVASESNNLPIARTAFIGREQDVADVKALLTGHGLVTLVGSGGVGKTRLAVQVGIELLERYPDGVWFVDLAPVADSELVSSVIAQTLGMSQQQERRVDESIPAWLKRKQLLLILDNCEHMVETIAPIAAAILRAAPDVRIVATSRQAVTIGGEEIVRIPSLDVPHTVADLTAAAVMDFAAVALFVSRATSVDRSFALTDDTAPIVADICRRARQCAREALRLARQAQIKLFIAVALQHLARLAGFGGEGRRAAALLGYVDASYAELGNRREWTEQWGYEKLLVALRETLSEDEIAQFGAEGATWSEDRAVEEALQA